MFEQLEKSLFENNIHYEKINEEQLNFDIDEEESIDLIFSEIDESSNLNNIEKYLFSYNKYASDFVESIQLEPILSETSFRYTVFPIKYKSIWQNYKDQLKINWFIEEVDLSKDVGDWKNKLTSNDRRFIMHILAFFAASDGIVNCNIKENLIDVVKLIDSVKTMSVIKKKADWCKKWIESDMPYAHKLIAFAIVEGVFFSGSFASI